jgi:hypothetical protein
LDTLNVELKGMWMEISLPSFKVSICLEGLRRSQKTSLYLIFRTRFEVRIFQISSGNDNHFILNYLNNFFLNLGLVHPVALVFQLRD